MRKLFCISSLLFLLMTIVSCDKLVEEIKKDSEFAENEELVEGMIGVWYAKTDGFQVSVYNLRSDRSAVLSGYLLMGGSSSIVTTVLSPWKVTDAFVCFGNEVSSIRRSSDGGWQTQGTTGHYSPMDRIYDPVKDKGFRRIPELNDRKWVGYYENKVITLEFKKDQTVVRVDKPNAGWDGDTVIREYEWFLNNGVIHLTAVDSEKTAYGVGLETEQLDRIFVDFGEECSVFNGSAIAE